jgi:hypothetical protein
LKEAYRTANGQKFHPGLAKEHYVLPETYQYPPPNAAIIEPPPIAAPGRFARRPAASRSAHRPGGCLDGSCRHIATAPRQFI